MSKIVASFKNLLEAELADSHGKVILLLYGAANPHPVDVKIDTVFHFRSTD